MASKNKIKIKIAKETETRYKRPSWDEYFMNIMEAVSARATCDRGRSGCVVVRDKRIIVTGYVGAPAGIPSCDEVGHELDSVLEADGTISKHCLRTTHAEQNAIVQAARIGVSIDGATLYCKMTPCYACAKMIINAGIKNVIALKDYHSGGRSKDIFKKAKVKFTVLGEMETYKNM